MIPHATADAPSVAMRRRDRAERRERIDARVSHQAAIPFLVVAILVLRLVIVLLLLRALLRISLIPVLVLVVVVLLLLL
eukprot:6146932-Pyramimonas_sp.AAC.1